AASVTQSSNNSSYHELVIKSNDKNILTEKEFTLNIEPNDNLSLNIEPMLNIERLSVTTNKQKR
ncbi:16325_t:CDS:2, partial [Rhizophagus irregularis]